MDKFKQQNVKLATKLDYNAKSVVTLSDRAKVSKLINRYARRALRQELKCDMLKGE